MKLIERPYCLAQSRVRVAERQDREGAEAALVLGAYRCRVVVAGSRQVHALIGGDVLDAGVGYGEHLSLDAVCIHESSGVLAIDLGGQLAFEQRAR